MIALIGPLGAGKSEFVRGLAEGAGLDPDGVSSPTFTIVNQYRLPDGRQLAHADFYRLEEEGEVDGVGFSDLLEPGMLVAVEWADRFPNVLPVDHLGVELVRDGAEATAERRTIVVEAYGPEAERVLERWRSELGASPAVQLE